MTHSLTVGVTLTKKGDDDVAMFSKKGNVYKLCACPPDQQPCPHPWRFDFKVGGKRTRGNLSDFTKQPAESLQEAQEQALRVATRLEKAAGLSLRQGRTVKQLLWLANNPAKRGKRAT